MPRIRLTKSAIDALPTPQSDVVFWDVGFPGFGVKVTPKGRKVFVVLYRTGGAGSGRCQTRPLGRAFRRRQYHYRGGGLADDRMTGAAWVYTRSGDVWTKTPVQATKVLSVVPTTTPR